MPETFAQYLEKWLKQSTAQGLNNPLVKMPVKRFRLLQPTEFATIANGGSLTIGTLSDPISRNLYKNAQTRIRERGEHDNAFRFQMAAIKPFNWPNGTLSLGVTDNMALPHDKGEDRNIAEKDQR